MKDEKKRKQECVHRPALRYIQLLLLHCSMLLLCVRSEDWEAFQAFAAAVPEPADDITPAQEDTELEREVAVADEQMCGCVCAGC